LDLQHTKVIPVITFTNLLEQNLVKDKGWLSIQFIRFILSVTHRWRFSSNRGRNSLSKRWKNEVWKRVLFLLPGLILQMWSLLQDSCTAGELSGAGVFAPGIILTETGQMRKQLRGYKNFSFVLKKEQKISFLIETYRSYVVTYNMGEVIIRDYIERNGAQRIILQENGKF